MDNIFRIIDANFNRAREGLRVIEDGIRFYYGYDKDHIRQIKEIRHLLSRTIAKTFGLLRIKKERDTLHDTGKGIDIREREDIREIIERNFMRVSEALRVMEEYSKAVKPAASSIFHNLRFKLYRIEKDVLLYIHRSEIPSPFLALLLNFSKKTALKDVKKIVGCNPDILILCQRGIDDKHFLKAARRIRKLIPHNVKYLICGRSDICILCDADGVFLNKKDIPYGEVKKLLQDKIILRHRNLENSDDASSLLKANYKVFEKKRLKIFTPTLSLPPQRGRMKVGGKGFRGVSPLNILTDEIKTVNISLEKGPIKSHLKEILTGDMDGIILIPGEDITQDIEKNIKMLKKEVNRYGRRRKETAGKK